LVLFRIKEVENYVPLWVYSVNRNCNTITFIGFNIL